MWWGLYSTGKESKRLAVKAIQEQRQVAYDDLQARIKKQHKAVKK
jgi:hypothetical protein